MKDYYKILELPMTSTQDEIKSQYRFLTNAWHPDKFSNPEQKAKANEKLRDINEAYAILGNSDKRRAYDTTELRERYKSREGQNNMGQATTPQDHNYQKPKEPVPPPRREPPKQDPPKQEPSKQGHKADRTQQVVLLFGFGAILLFLWFFWRHPPQNQVSSQSSLIKGGLIPKISTKDGTQIALSQGIRFLNNLSSNSSINSQGNRESDVYDLNENVLWSNGMCFKDKSILIDNWSNLSFEFSINGNKLPLDNFYTVDEEQDIEIDGYPTKQPAYCRFLVGYLFDWPIGDFELISILSITQSFYNGWETVMKDWVHKDVYYVNVNLWSATKTQMTSGLQPGATLVPIPTHENLWLETQTAKANVTQECIPWEEVDNSYLGKEVCIFAHDFVIEPERPIMEKVVVGYKRDGEPNEKLVNTGVRPPRLRLFSSKITKFLGVYADLTKEEFTSIAGEDCIIFWTRLFEPPSGFLRLDLYASYPMDIYQVTICE